jgi:hypothetical protein
MGRQHTHRPQGIDWKADPYYQKYQVKKQKQGRTREHYEAWTEARPERRENNLIIYGLDGDNERSTSETLRRFFAVVLRVDVGFRKAMRIGNWDHNRPPAILVNLYSREDKAKIYCKSHLLKGTSITVQVTVQ